MLKLDTPLSQSRLPTLTRKVLARFEDGLHIYTVRDLLFHIPHRYEEVGTVTPIGQLVPKQPARVLGVITSIKQGYTSRGSVANATIEDPTGRIPITWFNQAWVADRLKKGDKVLLVGKLTEGKSRNYLANPTYEIVQRAPSATKTTAQTPNDDPTPVEAWDIDVDLPLIPIYAETEGVTSRWINYLVHQALKRIAVVESAIESVPDVRVDMPLNEALRIIHRPQTEAEAEAAKKRILIEELLPIQCAVLRARYRIASHRAPAIALDADLIKQYLAKLPFTPTDAQRAAAFEIVNDMEEERPMHRLLVGDVGSGKTLVAAIAALNTARAKRGKDSYQVALMAPTEILATQHFEGLAKELRPERLRIGLLTGANSRVTPKRTREPWMKISKVKLHKEVAAGEIDIVIGTHALIAGPKGRRKSTLKPESRLTFHNLALAIVDEQHRFGVNQRAELAKLHEGFNAATTDKHYQPHFLTMTATPIPRSLALTIFGDLDLSMMTEMPKGRQPIETKLITARSRNKAYERISEEVAEGRQAYVICPLVSESEKVQAKSAEEEYERLSRDVFPDLRLGLLHGQMKAPEKQAVMKEFAKGDIDVLVATSVVEVGIDVPNATVIAIEGAERFGLAQLYQMRGRVGRGTQQSYCLLFVDRASQTAKARLKVLAEATSGSAVAEADLKHRGPGELTGIRQSGIPDIAMQAIGNIALIEETRALARELLQAHPALKPFPVLAKRVASVEQSLHLS